MKSVLVTGANKGIGFATVQKILESTDCAVFLGSRDATRGASAVAQLVKKNPEYATRVSALEIDVSSDESVKKAAEKVMATFGEEPQQLFGIVNNAGVLWEDTIKPALETNVYGMKRVNDAFSPMLRKEDGRIINIGSASGPVFVAECSAQRKKIFNNPAVTWADVEALIAEVLSAEEKGTLNKLGLGDWEQGSEHIYGFTKALVNCHTAALAKSSPGLNVRSITPGYIATDMTQPWAEEAGQTPQEMGMKKPEDGGQTVVSALLSTEPGYHSLLWYSAPADTKHGTAGSTVVMGCGRL